MASASFAGLRVLCFESRRAAELGTLIATFDGRPIKAPALREVPLESNRAAFEFAAALERGDYDLVVFLTGVGVRALVDAVAPEFARERLAAALGRVRIAVRGPKPLAAIRELGLAASVTAPEPNTWRELLSALDAQAHLHPLAGARVAVQEYGVSNVDLLGALRSRGAVATPVPVYRWELPDDITPLQDAVRALAEGEVDVVLFTSGIQAAHLLRIAAEMHAADAIRHGLSAAVVASIGPTTSETLREHGIPPDFEPSRPRSGLLVRETAERAQDILRAKRG